MNQLDLKLRSLRSLAKQNSRTIIDNISRNNSRKGKGEFEICLFCGSSNDITKEHVLPQWTYDGDPTKFFITTINGLPQYYNKATIPACSICNNNRLNSLEVYIQNLFSETDLETTFFNNDELEKIITWLEIIDYKFQVLDARRTFLKSKENGYIPYLADIPLSVLREKVDYSPYKANSEIRKSLKRIVRKSKSLKVNSLIVFHTSNKGFYFFDRMDDYIFIELPQFRKAFFCFHNHTFSNSKKAQKEADKIIKQVYSK